MGRRRPRRASVLRAEIAITVVAPPLKCHLLPNVLDQLEPLGLLSDQLLDVHHALRVVAGDPLDVGNRHAVSSLGVCRVSRRIPPRSVTYGIYLRRNFPQMPPVYRSCPAARIDSRGRSVARADVLAAMTLPHVSAIATCEPALARAGL